MSGPGRYKITVGGKLSLPAWLYGVVAFLVVYAILNGIFQGLREERIKKLEVKVVELEAQSDEARRYDNYMAGELEKKGKKQ